MKLNPFSDKILAIYFKQTTTNSVKRELKALGVCSPLSGRVIKLAKVSVEEAFHLGFKKVKKVNMYKFIQLLHKIQLNKREILI